MVVRSAPSKALGGNKKQWKGGPCCKAVENQTELYTRAGWKAE